MIDILVVPLFLTIFLMGYLGGIDSVIDLKALFEILLLGFAYHSYIELEV